MQQTLLMAGAASLSHAARGPRVHNGTYTIRNRVTGDHRTYRIKTQKDDARFAPGKRILQILTGPNNERDFTGVAFLDDDRVYVWTKKRGTQFEVLATMFYAIVTNAFLNAANRTPEWSRWQDRYEVLIEGTCVRCNRKLTHPESITSGIGPECAQIVGGR